MCGLQSSGFLSPVANLNAGQPSLVQLLTYQWDIGRPPRPLPSFPGLFLAIPSMEVNNNAVKRMLSAATTDVLNILAQSLQVRDGRLANSVQTALSQGQSLDDSMITSMARTANSGGREASMAVDLSKASSEYLNALCSVLNGRYNLAHGATTLAIQLLRLPQGQSQAPRIFTLLLAAICDISGPED